MDYTFELFQPDVQREKWASKEAKKSERYLFGPHSGSCLHGKICRCRAADLVIHAADHGGAAVSKGTHIFRSVFLLKRG
ncbi:hypothetical protein CLOM_g15998 [Closterium sp. NIES-68]|nr:hypothetical protein CLOM_g15998 [Closterium sp. NIES-68]GJP80491.1 hypothetical protein CLOP_g10697 [Closterium sp. NIES-67]GJP84048.1 hypothetical protein CLOP_g14140 [Closterium sp. NIES-67]